MERKQYDKNGEKYKQNNWDFCLDQETVKNTRRAFKMQLNKYKVVILLCPLLQEPLFGW